MSMNLFSIVEIVCDMKYKVSVLLLHLCVPYMEGLPINIVTLGIAYSKQPLMYERFLYFIEDMDSISQHSQKEKLK